jgi:hypothetical protein
MRPRLDGRVFVAGPGSPAASPRRGALIMPAAGPRQTQARERARATGNGFGPSKDRAQSGRTSDLAPPTKEVDAWRARPGEGSGPRHGPGRAALRPGRAGSAARRKAAPPHGRAAAGRARRRSAAGPPRSGAHRRNGGRSGGRHPRGGRRPAARARPPARPRPRSKRRSARLAQSFHRSRRRRSTPRQPGRCGAPKTTRTMQKVTRTKSRRSRPLGPAVRGHGESRALGVCRLS